MAVTIGFMALIFLRLFSLQVINHNYYQTLATNQHEFEKIIEPRRGNIYLTPQKSDKPLLVATNLQKPFVYAVPKEIINPANIAVKLGRVLKMSQQEILTRLSTGNQNYVILKKQLSDEAASEVRQEKLAGIYLDDESLRFYPEKTLASHVLGFVGFRGNERVGQYGIEAKFEQELAGQAGILGADRDVGGGLISFSTKNFVSPQHGDDIYLTLDPAIQFKVEQVLKAAVQKHGADAGSVIVMDPKTGAILALANQPDFNPNDYSKAGDVSVYRNLAVSVDYEPGSVFKSITMASAINEGKVTPDTTYQDDGKVTVDDREIKNSDGQSHGIENMTEVLNKSLNTGAVFVERQLGNDLFRKYVKNFGFGKVTNVELPAESNGNLNNLNQKGNVFFATASFGQGITVTPIQLVQAYSVLANRGIMVKPYLVSKIVHEDGTAAETEPKNLGQIIDPKTASIVASMLVDVIENGHGKRAGVKGYYIAGKTGTAQVAFTNRTGYYPNKNIGTFIGFGPVDNPAFLMIVRIDNPKDVKFAESTAAPAFSDIANFILNYLQITPSRQ